ncbi:MAG: flagellar basal body P-ring formation chaperone FlgA [Rhizomicrobium sp.]
MKTLLRTAILCMTPLAAWHASAQQTMPANAPRVVVPAHDIERGETIVEQDLDYASVAPDRLRPGIITSAADLEGREARRVLRAGELVRVDDVRRPILVARGSTVTMVFNEPGVSLTAVGRAMDEGGLGETVVVQNPVSFRQVSCVVTGAGEVRAGDAVTGAAAQLAVNQ